MASPLQPAVQRMPYSSRTPLTDGAGNASGVFSPAATGRGLCTEGAAPQRVPESHVALPFAPSPALVASLNPRQQQPRQGGGTTGAPSGRR